MINCQGISTGQKPSKRRQSYHINFFRTTSGKAINFGISSEQEGPTFTYSNGQQDCFLTFKNGRHKKPVFLSLAKKKICKILFNQEFNLTVKYLPGKNLCQRAKNQLIHSAHFWDTFNFAVPLTTLATPIFVHVHPSIFQSAFNFCEFASICKKPDHFIDLLKWNSGYKNSCNLRAFWPKTSPNMEFVQEHSK